MNTVLSFLRWRLSLKEIIEQIKPFIIWSINCDSVKVNCPYLFDALIFHRNIGYLLRELLLPSLRKRGVVRRFHDAHREDWHPSSKSIFFIGVFPLCVSIGEISRTVGHYYNEILFFESTWINRKSCWLMCEIEFFDITSRWIWMIRYASTALNTPFSHRWRKMYRVRFFKSWISLGHSTQ